MKFVTFSITGLVFTSSLFSAGLSHATSTDNFLSADLPPADVFHAQSLSNCQHGIDGQSNAEVLKPITDSVCQCVDTWEKKNNINDQAAVDESKAEVSKATFNCVRATMLANALASKNK